MRLMWYINNILNSNIFLKISMIISISIYSFNYIICDYFYNYEILAEQDKWIELRGALYSMSILFLLPSITTKNRLKNRALVTIFLFFLLGDITDRLLFHTPFFKKTELLVIFVVISHDFRKFKKRRDEI
jgi:hypothetical protein